MHVQCLPLIVTINLEGQGMKISVNPYDQRWPSLRVPMSQELNPSQAPSYPRNISYSVIHYHSYQRLIRLSFLRARVRDIELRHFTQGHKGHSGSNPDRPSPCLAHSLTVFQYQYPLP